MAFAVATVAANRVQPFLDRITPGDGAIDIGANVGAVTTQLAKAVGPTGRVLAIEPQRKAAEQCERECRDLPWVEVVRLAVSDHNGMVPFYEDLNSTLSSCAAENVVTMREVVEAQCATLDALAARVPKLTAIKIDAQGSEGRILRGASACLARTGLVWMVEIWPAGLEACGSSLSEVVRLFSVTGWSIVARGKHLEGAGMTWGELMEHTRTWVGSQHTNILVAR